MKALRNLSIYTLTSIINAGIPFFLLPVLTKYLPPADYGTVSLFQSFILFTAPVVILGIDGAISVAFFKHTKEELAEFVGTSMALPMIGLALVTIAFYFARSALGAQFGLPPEWVVAVPFFTFAQFPVKIAFALTRAEENPMAFGKMQIGQTILNLGLSIFFVVSLHMGWQGRLYGILLSFLVFAVAAFVYLIKNGFLRFRFSRSYFNDQLKFGIPLIPHAIGGVVITMADRAFLAKYVSMDDVGIFAVAGQLAAIVGIVITCINQVWTPILYKSLNDPATNDDKRLGIVRMTYMIYAVIVGGALITIVGMPIVSHFLVNEKFAKSMHYTSWLVVATSLNGLYYMVSNFIFNAKKTHLLAILTFTCAGIHLAITYFLVTTLGTIGAAYADCVTWGLFFFATWFLANRIYPLPWFSPGIFARPRPQ